MCGIVGIIQQDSKDYTLKSKVFNQLLFVDTLRGMDSTGIFYGDMDENSPEVFKKAYPMYDYALSKPYTNALWNIEKYDFFIGHNRAATKGAVNHSNAHPFVEGDITLIHNGTLTSTFDLPTKTVDSHAITAALAQENDPVKVLEKLRGAYALVWYDKAHKKLYISRNNERPLHYANTDIGIVIASEEKMLDWILDRNNVKYKSIKPFEVHHLYSFDYSKKGNIVTKKTKYDGYVVPQAVKTVGYYNSGYYYGGNSNTTSSKTQSSTTDQLLKECGFVSAKAGEFMRFFGMSFVKYNNNIEGKYGKILLTPTSHKPGNVEFVVHSQTQEDFDKLDQTKAYKGEVISGCRTGNNYDKVTFTVANKSLKLADTNSVIPFEPSHVQVNGHSYSKDEWMDGVVSDGCTMCGSDIDWKDKGKVDYMIWGNDKYELSVICPSCAQALQDNADKKVAN